MQPFDHDLIGIIPALVRMSESSSTLYFGAEFLPKVLEQGFKDFEPWLQNSPGKSWVFPICDEHYCLAVRIVWRAAEIQYYDPIGGVLDAEVWRQREIGVSASETRCGNVPRLNSCSTFCTKSK